MIATAQNNIKKRKAKSTTKRRTLARAYYQMYRAFLLRNLLSGMTLGAASHSAIQLMRAKISTMDKNNPIVKKLIRISARHAKLAAKHIMTSKHRDARVIAKPDQRAKMMATISNMINSGTKIIGAMVAQHKPKPAPIAAKPKVVAKPVLVKPIQIQIQMQYQHAM